MSIRQRLFILLLVVGLVPTVAVSAVAYATIRSELTTKTTDQVVSIATKQEQRINGLLQSKQEEVIKLANRYDLQTALQSPKTAQQAVIQPILLDAKSNVTEMQRVYVTDLSTKVLGTTATTGVGQPLPTQYVATAGAEQTTLSIILDPSDGAEKLCINTRIQINKKDAAILSVIFRVDDIAAAVQDYTGLGTTGETILAKRSADGTVVPLFPLRQMTDKSYTTLDLSSMHLFDKLDSNIVYQTDYRGHQVMMANRSVGFATDWVVAAKLDVAEAMGPINQLGNTLITILVAVVVSTMLIAFYLGRFFTRPILRIAQISRLIGAGDFSAQIDVRRSDELGSLAHDINTMASTIKTYVADLEGSRAMIERQKDELEDDQARLTASINSLRVGFVMTDTEGNVVLLNQSMKKLLAFTVTADGVSKQGAVRDGWTAEEMAQQFGPEVNLAGIVRATRTGKALERRQVPYNGRLLQIFAAPILDVDKSGGEATLGSVMLIEDVTEAAVIERSKDEFFSIASHELRTPLTAIRGNTSMIQQYYPEQLKDDGLREMIGDIHDSSMRLIEIVNDFLDVSRVEQGKIKYDLESFAVDEVIERVIYEMSTTSKTNGVAVKFDHMRLKTLPLVFADKNRIQQIIYNLLGNAMKFTHKGGSITVSAETVDGYLRIRVKDTGEGMTTEAQRLLFHKFQQAGDSLYTRNTSRGTGLGLYISKRLIEQMNGSMRLESSVPGEGSAFSFDVPLSSETAAAKRRTKRKAS